VSERIKTGDILTLQLDERVLPGIVRDIAAEIGLAAALKLVDFYQGVPMWVPVRFDPEHTLVKIVGAAATLKLMAMYPGEKPEIPRCAEAIRVVRNIKIRDSDKSQRQLAQEWNLTVRQIRNIQSGMEVDDEQEELF
jgi:hypothetical protein